MFITGEIVKVDTNEENFWMATVIHKHENDSYDVLLTETGEILNVTEDIMIPAF